jgi:hypothetical protein
MNRQPSGDGSSCHQTTLESPIIPESVIRFFGRETMRNRNVMRTTKSRYCAMWSIRYIEWRVGPDLSGKIARSCGITSHDSALAIAQTAR